MIFKVIGTDPWFVEEIFSKSFKSQATSLHFDEVTSCLAVGLANGRIRIFEIPTNFKFIKEVPYDSNEILAHTGPITGL